jgi:hypothetical protein
MPSIAAATALDEGVHAAGPITGECRIGQRARRG